LREDDAERTIGYDFDNDDQDGDLWTGWDAWFERDFWDEASTPERWGSDGAVAAVVDASWWGHCDMASAAIICEEEPTGNYQEGDVTFTPIDKKGLLVALYHGLEASGWGADIDPCEWQAMVEQEAVREGQMFASDIRNTGDGPDIVWNYPVPFVETELRQNMDQSEPTIVDVGCNVRYWHSSGDGQSGQERALMYAYRITYSSLGSPTINEGVNRWWGAQYGYDEPPDTAWLPTRKVGVDSEWWGIALAYEILATIIPLD
jgi:hypothetical protein